MSMMSVLKSKLEKKKNREIDRKRTIYRERDIKSKI